MRLTCPADVIRMAPMSVRVDHAIAVAIIGPNLETVEAINEAWKRKTARFSPSDTENIAKYAAARDELIRQLPSRCGIDGKAKPVNHPWFDPQFARRTQAKPAQAQAKPGQAQAQAKPAQARPEVRPTKNVRKRDAEQNQARLEQPEAMPVACLEQPRQETTLSLEQAAWYGPLPTTEWQEPDASYVPDPKTTLSLEQAAWYGPMPTTEWHEPSASYVPVPDPKNTLNIEQAAWHGPLPSNEIQYDQQVIPQAEPLALQNQTAPVAPLLTYDEPSPEPSPAPEEKKRDYTFHNRKPRGSDARRHMKNNHAKFLMEMKKVFSRRFEAKQGAHVQFSDLLNAFAASRAAKQMLFSDEEKKLFAYHSKKLFLIQWPDAKRRVVQDIVCYFHVTKRTS